MIMSFLGKKAVCSAYRFLLFFVAAAVAAAVNVLSYAAPLASLRVVLKERSTASMPAEMSVGNLLCAALWLAYGWIARDIFIVVPNLLGN